MHVPPAYDKTFMPLKRYIRNNEFDFPDETMGEMISNCFKTIS